MQCEIVLTGIRESATFCLKASQIGIIKCSANEEYLFVNVKMYDNNAEKTRNYKKSI